MAASNHTSVKAQDSTGGQFHVLHTSTDTPILPAENLRQLAEIDHSLVAWVIEQTERESAHRRTEEKRINRFILFERLSGIIARTIVSCFGLGLGGYLIMHNHDVAGVAISGVGLASIVSVLVARGHAKKPPPSSAGAACITGPRGGRYEIVNGRKRYGC